METALAPYVDADPNPFTETVTRVMTALDSVSGITDPEQWLIDALNGGSSKTGITVNEYTALGWPPLYAAVSRISGHIATMPLCLSEDIDDDGSFTKVDDPRNRLMTSPNAWQTGSVLKELMQMNSLLHGNGRAYIVRDSMGTPVELVPLLAWQTRTVLVRGQKFHWLVGPMFHDYSLDVLDPGRIYYLSDDDVLHIPGLGGNGAWGYSIIHMFRETIELGLAGQRASLKAFENMGRPGVILEAPAGKFRDPKKAKEFVEKFDASQAGIDNQGKTALLREGVTAKILSMSQEDAQFLAQRQFQREDAALVMFLEILTGDKGPYKSITEKNTQYMINCLNRWIVKWQEECDKKLRTEEEKLNNKVHWKFDPSVILQGDPNSLADYTGKLRQQGAINGHDVRRMHRLPAADDEMLDSYQNPNTVSDNSGSDDDETNERVEALENAQDNGAYENLMSVARNAIQSRVGALAAAESRRIGEATGRGPKFLAAAEKFYGKFSEDLAEVIGDIGGDRTLAQEYANTSLERIREAVMLTDDSQLEPVINGILNSVEWAQRPLMLADQILGSATDAV